MADQREFSVPRVINGFFTGVLIGGACLGLDFFLGLVLSDTHFLFVGSAMIAGLLIGIDFIAVKRSRNKGFLRGMLIALALA